jgi:hypothetical protein
MRLFGITRPAKLENIIKMDLKETVYVDVDWNNLSLRYAAMTSFCEYCKTQLSIP